MAGKIIRVLKITQRQLQGCLLLIFITSFQFPVNDTPLEITVRPKVRIPQGLLSGRIMTTRYDRNIFYFLGIPFAKPPIGNLRFANPVPADGWNGTLDASTESSCCPQLFKNILEGDEDCLYINVFTPQLPRNKNSTLFPVMLYIHGGGLWFGCQSFSVTGPGYLLDADVILVTTNYRLGALGFLSTGDEVASGNWGMKDQVLALEWIRDNIAYFGGDPDRVTVFGNSAGGSAVHYLTFSNLTIGLFHRYITQSGSAITPALYRPRNVYPSYAFELGKIVGCYNNTSDSLVKCLRTINFTDIVSTNYHFYIWQNYPDNIWGVTNEPDIKGAFLIDDPENLIAAGKIRDLPWMAGITRDEGLVHSVILYENEEVWNDFVENIDIALPLLMDWKFVPDSGAAWMKAIKSYYLGDYLALNKRELFNKLTVSFGDSYTVYPLINALRQHHNLATNPQYFYMFNYRGSCSYTHLFTGGTEKYGISHADELIYLFPMEESFINFNISMSEKDFQIVDTMVELWTSFAITGKPSAAILTGKKTWKPYSSVNDYYLRIGDGSEVSFQLQEILYSERMQFWSDLNAATNT